MSEIIINDISCAIEGCGQPRLPHSRTCSVAHRRFYRREYQRLWQRARGKRRKTSRNRENWNFYQRQYYRRKRKEAVDNA